MKIIYKLVLLAAASAILFAGCTWIDHGHGHGRGKGKGKGKGPGMIKIIDNKNMKKIMIK